MYVEYLRIVVLSETELIEVTDVKIWQTDNTDMYNVYCNTNFYLELCNNFAATYFTYTSLIKTKFTSCYF